METVASADGTPIAFDRSGSGPPLVLVHGTTADRTRWAPVRPALEEHVTVYAMDRRGRGDSGDAAEYALAREVEDVAAVLDAIDEPAGLLGHSFGALVALEAARRTDDLHALVLYEPAIPVGGHELYSEALVAELESLLADGEDERALVLFFREVGEFSQSALEALRSAPNWPARVAAAHTVLRETRAEYEYAFDAGRFERMTTPTLLLSGSESPRFLRAATEAVDDALPNSRIAVLDGQGHVAQNTAPDRFVDEVLAFLREPT